MVTTINLQHTLRVDYQPLSYPSKTPVDNSIGSTVDISKNPFFKDTVPVGNPTVSNSNQQFSPTNGNIPDENGFLDDRTPSSNGKPQFNFNPTLPKGTSGSFNVNFRPKVPKDPSSVYSGNPFLSHSNINPTRSTDSGKHNRRMNIQL